MPDPIGPTSVEANLGSDTSSDYGTDLEESLLDEPYDHNGPHVDNPNLDPKLQVNDLDDDEAQYAIRIPRYPFIQSLESEWTLPNHPVSSEAVSKKVQRGKPTATAEGMFIE